MNVNDHELPPIDVEAEARVLGAVLLLGSVIADALEDETRQRAIAQAARLFEMCSAECFWRQWHHEVFETAARLRRQGLSFGFWSVLRALQERRGLGEREESDLTGLLNAPHAAGQTGEDLAHLRDLAAKRALLSVARQIEQEALRKPGPTAAAAALAAIQRVCARFPVAQNSIETVMGHLNAAMDLPL